MTSTAKTLIASADNLRKELNKLTFEHPVHLTYNPLIYAWDAHCEYIQKFAQGKRKIIFLGMNPGPFGMAQTGVPFGEIAAVRDWMGIQSTIGKPKNEHPKRPIEGFNCKRSEVSGRRLWGLFSEKFASANTFFIEHFVLNYCPLLFMSKTGANITPDKLSLECRQAIEHICDRHLASVLETLSIEWAIGVGGYAEQRILNIKNSTNTYKVTRILHPSPASPAANRDWSGTVTKQLIQAGVW